MKQTHGLRPLLLLGFAGVALLICYLFFVNKSLSLPPLTSAPATFAPASWAGRLVSLLLLAFPVYGFYSITSGRIHSPVPAVIGGVALVTGFLAGNGTISALQQGAVYGLSVLGLVNAFYGTQLRWRSLLPAARQLLAGLGAFGVHLGIGVLFLWLATLLGATGDDSALHQRIAASPWPWLMPLAIGVSAALFEELVFRKWIDALFTRWTRSWIVTAFVSSLLWSLVHLQYDVSPWYLRLIEIGLLTGPVSFWIYKKYGLYAAVLGHLFYNAFLVFIAM